MHTLTGNDAATLILSVRQHVDIDAHYGDGVQAAFWADPRC